MAVYNTPWGVRELPEDEATGLGNQVPGTVTLASDEEVAAWRESRGESTVTEAEGANPKPGDTPVQTAGKTPVVPVPEGK
jgi:hypothetical protein